MRTDLYKELEAMAGGKFRKGAVQEFSQDLTQATESITARGGLGIFEGAQTKVVIDGHTLARHTFSRRP